MSPDFTALGRSPPDVLPDGRATALGAPAPAGAAATASCGAVAATGSASAALRAADGLPAEHPVANRETAVKAGKTAAYLAYLMGLRKFVLVSVRWGRLRAARSHRAASHGKGKGKKGDRRAARDRRDQRSG
ncbi:hypothetical protein GCM10010315_24030 [Streptomyces luteosporeus]|uniref:Uncharacterized protein n=1 Tax=Streptomyces luteosporeus TaxID=173856 RepID=A0ABP6G592_9ACTN